MLRVPLAKSKVKNFSSYKFEDQFVERNGERLWGKITYEMNVDKEKQEVSVKNKKMRLKFYQMNRPEVEQVATLAKVRYATLDIEAYENQEDQTFIPYAIAVYENESSYHINYLADQAEKGEKGYEQLIKATLKYIVDQQIKIIYAHNAKGFDNILLLRLLTMKGVQVTVQTEVNKKKLTKLKV